jgi:chitodextrinase
MKTFKSYMIITAAIMALTIGLAHCSSGGSSSGSSSDKNGDSTAITLSGVAAAGAPIASAVITLKDGKGSLKTGVTGTDGKYSIDITDMTAPFLLKVPSGDVDLYSVATSSGTANVHPYTDLIVRNWYAVKGSDINTAFSSTGALPSPPTAADISTIEAAVKSIMKTWLQQEGLDTSSFNLITSSFDANSVGFDKILDMTMVEIDSSGQVTVESCDATTGLDGTMVATNITKLTATDTTPPSDPVGLVVTGADKNKIVLVWSSSTDDISVAGYNIYRDGAKIGKSPAPLYTDSAGLQPSTHYCYQIEAFDGAGNVSVNKSVQVCSATLGASDTALPSTPTGLTAAISTSQISLSWTASTDALNNLIGYKVYRDGNRIESVAIPATSFVDDKKLSAHTQYCYTVKAFDSAGNVSPDSNQVCITTP